MHEEEEMYLLQDVHGLACSLLLLPTPARHQESTALWE